MSPDEPRDPAEVRAYYERMQRDHTAHPGDYSRGIVAALAWALGESSAPINGSPVGERPGVPALVRETICARDVLYGRVSPETAVALGRGYAAGVEATLMWVSREADQLPWVV